MPAAPLSGEASPTSTSVEAPPTNIPEIPVQAVANQLGDVATDTGRLLELQFRLFETECRQSAQMLVIPLVLFVISLMLAGTMLTGLLFALSWALQGFGLSPAMAWLLSAVVAAALSGTAMMVGWSLLRTPRISFAKSKEELLRNAACLAQLLRPVNTPR